MCICIRIYIYICDIHPFFQLIHQGSIPEWPGRPGQGALRARMTEIDGKMRETIGKPWENDRKTTGKPYGKP